MLLLSRVNKQSFKKLARSVLAQGRGQVVLLSFLLRHKRKQELIFGRPYRNPHEEFCKDVQKSIFFFSHDATKRE